MQTINLGGGIVNGHLFGESGLVIDRVAAIIRPLLEQNEFRLQSGTDSIALNIVFAQSDQEVTLPTIKIKKYSDHSSYYLELCAFVVPATANQIGLHWTTTCLAKMFVIMISNLLQRLGGRGLSTDIDGDAWSMIERLVGSNRVRISSIKGSVPPKYEGHSRS